QPPGARVVEASAMVTAFAPFFREGPPESPAIPRARPGALFAALQLDDPLLGGLEEAGVGDDLPVAGGQEPRHPDIDPNLSAGGWQRHGLHLRDDDHVPAAALPLELQRLPPTDNRPMLAALH